MPPAGTPVVFVHGLWLHADPWGRWVELIAQRLLGQNLAAAAVAIDAAPIKAVLALPPSALRVASIALRNPANRRRAISLTPEQEFPGRALTIESGWREIADSALEWLRQHAL
jgi:hypothetical protein